MFQDARLVRPKLYAEPDARYKIQVAIRLVIGNLASCIWYQVSGVSHPRYYPLIVKVATGFVF